VSERRMGYRSQGIEWAQPQGAIGVRGHGGEVLCNENGLTVFELIRGYRHEIDQAGVG